MDRKFKVIEHEKHSGLTVGSFSRKPGFIFTEKQWTGDSETLEDAIEGKRCIEITEKEVEKEEKKEVKKESNKEADKLKKEYQKLSDNLVKLKVGKDDDKIAEIESRMKEIEAELS